MEERDSASRQPDAAIDGTSDESGDEEFGLSLEELGQTYAQLLGQGAVPYQANDETSPDTQPDADSPFDPVADELVESDKCPITPLSILEAVMFVGRPDNAPIEAAEIAGMMRGVRAAEIQQLVAELNETYERDGHVMRIVASGEGYRLQLADAFADVGHRFYGRVREIKLTQAAIDCLAIVAYRPGITREELEELRSQPCGGILGQMVRRQLLEMRREGAKKQRVIRYYPTDRLLKLAGMESLEELPLAEDFD